MRKGYICCVDCRQEAPPSKKDSIYCLPCRDRLYARLHAADGEGIDGNALLDSIFRKHKTDMPSEVGAGDGERLFKHEMFTVTKEAS